MQIKQDPMQIWSFAHSAQDMQSTGDVHVVGTRTLTYMYECVWAWVPSCVGALSASDCINTNAPEIMRTRKLNSGGPCTRSGVIKTHSFLSCFGWLGLRKKTVSNQHHMMPFMCSWHSRERTQWFLCADFHHGPHSQSWRDWCIILSLLTWTMVMQW